MRANLLKSIEEGSAVMQSRVVNRATMKDVARLESRSLLRKLISGQSEQQNTEVGGHSGYGGNGVCA